MPVQTVIKLRRDTAANWESTNPVLASGEEGYETDTGFRKIGNGTSAWAALPYMATSRIAQTVKNTSGSPMTKGSVVYISGATGGDVSVSLADADTEATSSKTIGLLGEAIANDGFGEVVTEGLLSGVNTASATAGQSVWLSSTAGGFVFNAPPAKPAHSVYLGVVTRVHATEGEILVKVQNGYELEELHNVNITTPDPGSSLIWDDVTSMWIDKKLTVTDTLQTAGVSDGDTIVYDLGGSGWAARPGTAAPNRHGWVLGSTDGAVGYQTVALGAGAAGSSTGNMDSTVAIGQDAMGASLWGNYTVAVGHGAMATGEPGGESVAIGYDALSKDSSSGNNVAVGAGAMYNFTTGAENTAVGHQALNDVVTGSQNVALGTNSGGTGSGNVFLGYAAGSGSTASNKLYIANSNTATPLIYGEFDNAKVSVNGSLKFIEAPREKFYTDTTAMASGVGYNFDVKTNGSLQYLSTASTGNGSLNVRASSTVTLNSWLAVGESVTINWLITNGATAYYPALWRVDFNTLPMKWLGGTAPSSGNANAVDSYSITIVKTADATFMGFGAVSKFA